MSTPETAAAELTHALKPADARAKAIELIRALAPEGHALSYLAGALRRACIPTLSGRGTWQHGQVRRLADEAGIKVGYGRAA